MEHRWNSLNIDPVVTLEQCKIQNRHIHKTDKVNSLPKLRTYRFLKNEFGMEDYLKLDRSVPLRSYLAKTPMGKLALKIETGRLIH